MKKSEITFMPEFYDRYITQIEDMELDEALKNYGYRLFETEAEKFEELENRVYADGKWTIKEILQHIIDSERIFCYRALRFARKDQTPLPGFDENKYVPVSDANSRLIHDLLKEFETVRLSSIFLFRSFNREMLLSEGISFGKNISVLAIGFAIAGHSVHHLETIKEKYYPML